MMNCFESALDVRDLVHQGKDAHDVPLVLTASSSGVGDLVHQGKDAHSQEACVARVHTTWQVIALPGEIEEDKDSRRRRNSD
jgi:hypothetical protein